MSGEKVLHAGFTNEDVLSSTAYGMLWLVERARPGKWGLKRLRRGKNGWLYTSGDLVWKVPWSSFPEPVEPGKVIFRSHAGTSVLIDWKKKKK